MRRVSFINSIIYLTHTDNNSQPLKSCSIFVVTKVLHCPSGKPYTAFVFLDTVSFISGLVYVGVEYMMLGRLGLGGFRFFLLQGLAVSVETIVSNVLSLLDRAWQALEKQRFQHQNCGRDSLGTSECSCGFGGPCLSWWIWVFRRVLMDHIEG